MKKVLKKSLALILALTLVLGVAPLAGLVGLELPEIGEIFAEKAEAATYGVLSYEITDGEVAITGCDESASGALVIPDKIEGYPVTRIRDNAFFNCTGLTNVTIGNGVTNIGDSAFGSCNNLKTITVDESNLYYSSDENGVMFNKDKTLLIKYPIGNERTEYIIPNGVTRIGRIAFSGCENLTSVIIPDSITSIEWRAFEGCIGLTSVTIPDSVTSIDSSAFYNTGIYNNSSNWENGVLYIGNHLIKADSKLTGFYSIKPGTKIIGNNAFYNCDSLTSVKIPDSVTNIGDSAFANSGLRSVTIGNGVTSIDYSAFEGCTGLTSITTPDSVTSIKSSAFKNCTGLTSVTIGNGVTIIGKTAFSGCENLTSITIPDSVTSIGNCAFENTGIYNDKSNWKNDVLYIGNHLIKADTKLSGSYSIKSGAKTIADYAFYLCSIESVTIPDSVTSIGNCAFQYCRRLKSVTIGNGVECISYCAFYECESLTSVTIPDSVTSIGGSAFARCTGLKNVTIPNSVTNIEIFAFYNCAGLTSVTIPDSVTSMGDYAFYYCTGLTRVKIGNSVTSIGDYAFWNCDGLTSVTIPDSVTSIGDEAFFWCSSLTNVTIGNGVTSIGCSALEGCTRLADVIIGNSVTAIDDRAFACCNNLTDVYYAGSQEQWSKINIGVVNECLTNATIHFNFVGTHIHSYVPSVTKAATCTQTGIITFTCLCGDSYTEETQLIAHTPSEWKVTVEPTETNEGRKIKTCTECGAVIEEAVITKLSVALDSSSGISVTYSAEEYDGKVELLVREYFDGTAFTLVNTKTGATQTRIYDVTMTVDGVVTQPMGFVKVKIPIPTGFDPTRAFIYHIDTNTGTIENMNAVVDGDYLVFETDHFSYYAVVEVKGGGEDPVITPVIAIRTPSRTAINYGDSIILHADTAERPPVGAYYEWTFSDGGVFDSTVSESGNELKITPKKSGSTVITVTLRDLDGNVIGSDEVVMTAKAGVFDKIVAFFKKIFGLTKTIPEAFKGIF